MDKSAKICCTIFVQNYQLLYAVKEFVTSSDCDDNKYFNPGRIFSAIYLCTSVSFRQQIKCTQF